MLLVVFGLLCIITASSSQQQTTPNSPCPNVFQYEPPGSETGRWYGVVNLSTDSTLHSLWLNIVLDSKADILGNWIGDVTTTDNIDFKIENTQKKIHPGPATAVRFFVQFNLLNKVPWLQAIRLNGREICNANNPVPAVDRPDIEGNQGSATTRPQHTDSSVTLTRPQSGRPHDEERPTRPQLTQTVTRPAQGTKPTQDNPSPVYVPTENPPINQAHANPYGFNNDVPAAQSVGTQTRPRPETHRPMSTTRPRSTTTTVRYDDEDFDDSNRPVDASDYFGGVPVTLVTGNNNQRPSNNNNFYDSNSQRKPQSECGKVIRNANPNPLVVNGKPTLEGQWPWQIALYQSQTVDNKYICGGTLVGHQHIITAAHCVTRKGSSRLVNKNTLTIYLGKHNLRTSIEGVQIRFVSNIVVHPDYNATSFANDLAVLELREPASYSDWVRTACLWPESQIDLSNVVGKKGSVVGWGFDEKGVATEELTLVEMPVIDQETCIRSYSEFFARFTSEYTYCAGYRNGTSVCNGDSGGGMVFNLQGSWYLRGLVSLSVARQNEYRCDPSHYVVFTDLAKFSSWLKEIVNSN